MAKWRIVVLGCALSGLAAAGSAAALQFPDPLTTAVQYGDFYSYSLPLLATFYNPAHIGPGNPYYVDSTPGAIKDLTVVGTGSNGTGVTTNYSGSDDAYATPTGVNGSSYFSTKDSDLGGVKDPGANYGPPPAFQTDFTGDTKDTWDIRLSALDAFLNPNAGDQNDLIVYFNNNQTKSGGAVDENLYAWSLMTLVDDAGVLPTLYFELANFHTNNDPTQYAYDGVVNDWVNRATPGDFVLSGGKLTVCFNGTNQVIGVVPPLPSCPGGTDHTSVLDHNLGANQAAYALTVPELNAILKSDNFGGYDVLQWYIRMADLNNGYEQIFLGAGQIGGPPAVVPEPGTMLLLGSGLLGLAGAVRRRAARKT